MIKNLKIYLTIENLIRAKKTVIFNIYIKKQEDISAYKWELIGFTGFDKKGGKQVTPFILPYIFEYSARFFIIFFTKKSGVALYTANLLKSLRIMHFPGPVLI